MEKQVDPHEKGDSPLCIGATVKHEVHKLESGFISWDHGIITEAGRDPCSEQDQLQQVSQGCDKSGFKELQSWRHRYLFG